MEGRENERLIKANLIAFLLCHASIDKRAQINFGGGGGEM